MKTITLLLGAGALAVLSAGTAAAGPCTAEIDNVTKLLASKDAGAGRPQAERARPRVSIRRARPWVRPTRARPHRLQRRNRGNRSIRPRRQ